MIYNEPFLIDIVIESKKSPRSHAALLWDWAVVLMLNLSCIFNWNDANCIKWPPDKLEMGSAKPQRGDQDKCEIPQSLWHLDNYSGWVCILNPDECRWFRIFLTSRYQGIVKATVSWLSLFGQIWIKGSILMFIDLDVSNLEYRIFVLIFSSAPIWRETKKNIRWATKDISQRLLRPKKILYILKIFFLR